MLSENSLKDILSTDLSDTDKLLVCLAVDHKSPKAVKDIKALAFSNGFRRAKRINVSDRLKRSNKLARRVESGWELTGNGIEHIQRIAGPLGSSPIPEIASSLRIELSKIKDTDTAAFVEEAIVCYEMKQYRASVVLSWIGAVSVLYQEVINNHLKEFNDDATSRFASSKNPWVPAKKTDDLARMNEANFLVVLEKIGVIDKNLKQQLENALKLRNSCGHPNSYKLGKHKVSAHIEDLILNVFSVY